jgi:peptidoglycan hydrolase-like protein with peptidoglycan-binding domain
VPTASSKANDERSQRIARLRPDSAKIELMPAAPAGESDVETIRAIQRELAQRGYGPLPSDGVLRALTGAAIMAYEYDHGLALTGEASDALLKRILLGAPGGSDQAGAGKARSARAEQLIGSMQHALAALGYQPGRLDGQLGEETSRAIREFEMDKGLVPKGRISAELMLRLTEAAAASKPSSR